MSATRERTNAQEAFPMGAATSHARSDSTAELAKSIWAGWVLSVLAIAFLALDGVMKLIQPKVVIDATAGIGSPADPLTLATLGTVLLVSTALYAFLRASVLGAILLTGTSAARSPLPLGTTIRCSPTTCSASASASWRGADCGSGTSACARRCR
jgi:hypothetical protein